ncbi:zinc-dependent alcohol dehydrogenase [Fredinandcohnia humi]
MKAIVTSLGQVSIVSQPEPVLSDVSVLVKTIYSAISPGTELGIIHNKTEIPHALGYSAVGEVLDVGSTVTDIKTGDIVACYGGPYVHHSEILNVPRTLCVKVPEGVSLKEAAFVGLGGIAIHGVRRAKLQFGESVLVMGLGLLGQIISQVCYQANYQVIATDINPIRCELLNNYNSNVICLRSDNNQQIKNRIYEITENFGVDAVIISAHSTKVGLIDQALDYVAPQGRVVVVGNIPTSYSRERFFQKEADVVISRAAGPGRYDPQYEKQAIDYPKSYVRWTEGRNISEYIRLVSENKIKIDHMITKEFHFHNAQEAYQTLQEDPTALGVIFKYE